MTDDKLATVDDICGTAHLVKEADDKLKKAPSYGHLVSPATRVGSLPPGCGLAVSVVTVDPSVDERGIGTDVFKIEGRLMLQKHIMDQIGTALGVRWDPVQSRRVDNGSDPHYCHFQAVGHIRLFDLQVQPVVGHYELDLRDGAARIEGMSPKQLKGMRTHIVSRAETGARNRAISSHGVRRSYKAEELTKPFIVAKAHFTGQSDDPELRRMFAHGTIQAMLGAQNALYGAAPAALPAPESAEPVAALPAASEIIDAPVEPPPIDPPPVGPKVPYGPEEGRLLADATTGALKICSYKLSTDMNLGMEEEGDRALLEAINAVMESRDETADKNY